MSQFMNNIDNTAMYVNGESWRIAYTYSEVSEEEEEEETPPIEGEETDSLKSVSSSKKNKASKNLSRASEEDKKSYVLNQGKLEDKPSFDEIKEGFYRFSTLGNNSKIWGTLLEDTNAFRSNYKEAVFFYKKEENYSKIKENISEGDILEFFPVGRMCQGGYNISAERQTQQISNSCGSFVLPLAQVNKTANITAIYPKPFDTNEENFTYDLFNAQFQIVNQKKNKAISYMKAKQEKIRFFFLLFAGNENESEYQTVVSFEGYLMNNSLSNDVSSNAVISLDTPVTVQSEIAILNHDYYKNELLGV